MIRGLHHAALVTPDLERAKKFYCDVFEFKLLFDYEWGVDDEVFHRVVGLPGSVAKMCLLRGGNTYLELFEYRAPSSRADPSSLNANDYGIRHLAFEVDDVHEVRSRFQAHGGITMDQPVSVPDGPVSVYCRDPFGNLIELIQPGGPMPGLGDI